MSCKELGPICIDKSPPFYSTEGPTGHNDGSDPVNPMVILKNSKSLNTVKKTTTSKTLQWNISHLKKVIRALERASKLEFILYHKIYDELSEYGKQKIITIIDYDELTIPYFSLLVDGVPYFRKMGDYLNTYSTTSHFFPSTYPPILHAFSGEIISSKEAQNATKKGNMEKTKELLLKWFDLLIVIEKKRNTAADFMGLYIKRKTYPINSKLINAHRRAEHAYRIIIRYENAINEVKNVTKFINKLKDIQELNDELNLLMGLIKNPKNTLKAAGLAKVKSTLSGSKGKWDVIKAGVEILGYYYSTIDIKLTGVSFTNAVDNYTKATFDIIMYAGIILAFNIELAAMKKLGETNEELYSLDCWGGF